MASVSHHAVAVEEALESLAYLQTCLLYTSDAADERSSVDLGGRRIIKKKKKKDNRASQSTEQHT